MSPHHHGGARLQRPPRPNCREHHPSFSAALLDAIYHSLDADGADPRRAPVSPAERSPRPPGRHRPSTNLSPSVSSVRSPRLQRTPRPCRVRPHPQPSLLFPPPPPPPPPGDSTEKKRNKRKKAKSAPFACLLDALLCNRKSAKPIESTRTTRDVPAATAEPASARSILSSRASRRESAAGAGGFLTPGRRAVTVRFSPAVTVVVDEERGREEGASSLRDTGRMEVVAARESAAEADRRVEELLRVLGVAEKERAKESSESSSDLFELESLAALDTTESELPLTRAAGTAGTARPRPRVLLDDMII